VVFDDGLGAHLAGQRRRFVVLTIVAFFVYGTQPKLGASPAELVSFYDGDRTRILIATVIFCTRSRRSSVSARSGTHTRPHTRCTKRPENPKPDRLPAGCAPSTQRSSALVETESDRELEKAQAALLARFAPETRVRRIRWSQGETQVFELGVGSPLLYVHGGLSGAFEVVPILAALAEAHRVLAIDRPGHGMADPFDYRGVDLLEHGRTFLRDILDELELPTVDVVANSIGALWSVAFAIEAPTRVSHLVLVGAPVGLSRRPPLRLLPIGLPLIGRRLGRYAFSNATRDGNRKFWGQLLVEHPGESTICCSTSTSRTRDGTSRACSAWSRASPMPDDLAIDAS
jgi:pimeloyl-ACP methyl ester carboxylesterase